VEAGASLQLLQTGIANSRVLETENLEAAQRTNMSKSGVSDLGAVEVQKDESEVPSPGEPAQRLRPVFTDLGVENAQIAKVGQSSQRCQPRSGY
jgi:hypothetical protein